jgi:hypothetical protein
MDVPTLEQNFMDYTNAILHPKKYFSHLYQGSVPEFCSIPHNHTHTCELVHENREPDGPTRSHLEYRYGLSVGQLINRINKKVDARELSTSIDVDTCIIRPTSPKLERKPITDIRSLLSDEADSTCQSETAADLPDSTMTSEETQREERRWSLGTQNLCQVCGDKAAGFYCRAFVCEACKVNTPKCISCVETVSHICLKA